MNAHDSPLALTPEASLNRMPVVMTGQDKPRPARYWVSTPALLSLIHEHNPGDERSVRQFLTTFSGEAGADQAILQTFATRLIRVIQTAHTGQAWADGSDFQRRYAHYWQSCETLVLAGGLTSGEFGQQLAHLLENALAPLNVLVSPWAGQTGLVGLAQHYGSAEPLVVMDFGATGIKRGLAYHHGNRIVPLPELTVDHWLDDQGLFRADAFRAVLKDTREHLDGRLPVAISLACYLDHGHPHDYRSGVYHRLIEDCEHLATTLHQQWLPGAGFSGLALLEHDSTAAALAFRFSKPAMMVTLGTGLGVGVCPRHGGV
ncbi:MAG: hypothetical protein ABJ000_00415 [Saccharospirillum sp.]|uniref:hypothetical protein n=1 Tax=Saccharospirillum sp. TaxID=2033801 RepID=UPI00329A4C82